jgi:hypothetical protein
MSNLILDNQRDTNPENESRVEIPRFNVSVGTNTTSLGPPSPIATPTPSDGGLTAGQVAQQPLTPTREVGGTLPTLGPDTGFETMVTNAENQIRGEFNWRRNAFTSMDSLPLFDSRVSNPWTQSSPIDQSRLVVDIEPSERLRSGLERITGIDPQRTAFGSAFRGMNQTPDNREGRRPDRLRDVMERLGFRNINPLTRGIANFAGVGGAAANLVDSAMDATLNPLFDQTLGRAVFGSGSASRDWRMERRERDFLQPARELGADMLEPNEEGDSTFGIYGSGLPGAINMASDYVGNVVGGTGLSVWRGGATILSAMRGEDYAYGAWDEPMWNALNPLQSDEVFSFLEDPEYSPITLRRFIPPEYEEGAEGVTAVDRFARRAAVVGLVAAGFLLDAGRPDIDSLNDIGRWATRSGAARNIADAVPTTRPAAAQTVITAAPTQPRLPGAGPNQPLLPSGSSPLSLDLPDLGPDPTPYRLLPPGGGAAVDFQVPYQTLFSTPDGAAVQVPRTFIPDLEPTLRSADPGPTYTRGPGLGEEVAPTAPGRGIEVVAPAPQRNLDEVFGVSPRRADVVAAEAVDVPSAAVVDGAVPTSAVDVPDSPDAPNVARSADDAPTSAVEAPESLPLSSDQAADALFDDLDNLGLVEPVRVPIDLSVPVRRAGVAESILRQSVDSGDLVVRPAGRLAREIDVVEGAQKRLIANRLEDAQLARVPEGFRTAAERARVAELGTEFTELRTTISGRPLREAVPIVADSALPIVPQSTLTPPANPAKLYQWSRNLPDGQRIYLPDVEFEPRTAGQLTELAKFFGHADVGRTRVLSGDQIADLRQTYGSLYSGFGPPIDRQSLKNLNVEGAGRIEVVAPDAVSGAVQESVLYSSPVTRSVDDAIKRADEFGNPKTYTATQLSELATDELGSLLDTQFSNKAVYATGSRDPILARTRAELMDEVRFRNGESIDETARIAGDADEIDDYLEAVGVDIDPDDLGDDAFNELAERAALDAERRASTPVEAVKKTLPSDMKPTSVEGDSAIRNMIAAEQEVGDAMSPVRELVEIIEELERRLAVDGRALSTARLPQGLNTGTYDAAGTWHTRQMGVDKIADRTDIDLRRVSQPNPVSDAPAPIDGTRTTMGTTPTAGAKVVMLDGRTGTLSGSQFGTGADAEWEVRLADGTMAQAPRTELFPDGTAVARPAPAATRVWYLGTRADVNIEQYSGVFDGPTHQAMGPGTYLVSDPKVAEDGARAMVARDAVANYPIATQGNVHRVGANVQTILSGAEPLKNLGEAWVGMRGLIKTFFGDDQQAVTIAARRKNLVQFYDYLARKLDDDVRLADFQGRMAVFLHAQGIDAIQYDGPSGNVLNVIRPDALTPGDTTKVGGMGALEQMAASTNFDGAMANTFGTRATREVADQSHYRFGLQMRAKMVEHLKAASDRVNAALARLDRADASLEGIARVDAEAAGVARAADARRQLDTSIDTNTKPPGACL